MSSTGRLASLTNNTPTTDAALLSQSSQCTSETRLLNSQTKRVCQTRFLHTRNMFSLTVKRVWYKRETRLLNVFSVNVNVFDLYLASYGAPFGTKIIPRVLPTRVAATRSEHVFQKRITLQRVWDKNIPHPANTHCCNTFRTRVSKTRVRYTAMRSQHVFPIGVNLTALLKCNALRIRVSNMHCAPTH